MSLKSVVDIIVKLPTSGHFPNSPCNFFQYFICLATVYQIVIIDLNVTSTA